MKKNFKRFDKETIGDEAWKHLLLQQPKRTPFFLLFPSSSRPAPFSVSSAHRSTPPPSQWIKFKSDPIWNDDNWRQLCRCSFVIGFLLSSIRPLIHRFEFFDKKNFFQYFFPNSSSSPCANESIEIWIKSSVAAVASVVSVGIKMIRLLAVFVNFNVIKFQWILLSIFQVKSVFWVPKN